MSARCFYAPAKAILFGEHAVVYGKRAVASSLGRLGTIAWSKPSENGRLEINLYDVNLAFSIEFDRLSSLKERSLVIDPTLLALLKDLTEYLQIVAVLISITVRSNIPIGSGLGSSSSFSVALSAALIAQSNQPLSKTMINYYSQIIETILNGKVSGIDNTVSTFGGTILFHGPGEFQAIQPRIPSEAYVIHTKIPKSTFVQLEKVCELRKANKVFVDEIFDSIDSIVKQATCMLSDSMELDQLSQLVEQNQSMLQSLGVSNPFIDRICEVGAKYGYSCKITGAGGGGCLFAIKKDPCQTSIESNGSLLKKELESLGAEVLEVEFGVPGVEEIPITDLNAFEKELTSLTDEEFIHLLTVTKLPIP